MNVTLIHPPFATPASPPYAIAKLHCFLKNNTNENLKVLDLNLLWHHMEFNDLNSVDFFDEKAITEFKNRADKTYSQNNKNVREGQQPSHFNELIKKILNTNPTVVAFSVLYSSQSFYTLSLLKKLKEHNIITVIGGPAVNSILKENADHYFSDEIRFYEYITNKKVYNDENKLNELNYDTLVDYSIFSQKYFTPQLVIPLKTSTCCYYQQCTFCTHHGHGRYVEFPLKNVVDSIIVSKAKHVFLIDDMIHKKRLLEIAKSFKPLGITWMCQLRPTKDMDKKTLQILYECGLRSVIWGVESGSNRILTLMKKGTNTKDTQQVLQDAKTVGITNVCYIMFGFPTETKEECIETIHFLQKNTQYIDLVSTAVFGLQKGSYIFDHPQEFMISNIHLEQRTVLEPKITYSVSSGLTSEEAKSFRNKYKKTLKKINKFPKVFNYFREYMLTKE